MPIRQPRPTDVPDYNPDEDAQSLPFDQRPDESPPAYEAFRLYCTLQHPDRALKRVAHDLKKGYECIKQWSSNWQWKERVRHHDAHMAKIAREAEEKEVAEHAAKWKRRQLEAAETSWEHNTLASKTALAMLDTPLFADIVEATDADGRAVTINRTPLKWSLKDAAALMKLAAELRGDALGNALGSQDDGFDPTTATAEECREYLEGKGLVSVTNVVNVNVGSNLDEKGES